MTTQDFMRGDWVKPNPLSDPKSLERRFRTKRFENIKFLIDAALAERDHVEILDLGGTEQYWAIADDYLSNLGDRITITLVNNETTPPVHGRQFISLEHDACDPDMFRNRRFDVVHSNSVIEHVGELQRMQAFADNVRRLTDRYFIQTPNYWFPLEPHFRIVGFQWLPLTVRAALMQRYNLGFFPRAKTPEEAWDNVREIRLLDVGLMRRLFPDAELRIERICGFSKSIMAIGNRSALSS